MATIEQMMQLRDLLKSIKFFADRKIKNNNDLMEIALNILLEQFNKDELVFDFDAIGDKFFILLQGKVGVDIPIKRKVPSDELSRRRKKHDKENATLAELNL